MSNDIELAPAENRPGTVAPFVQQARDLIVGDKAKFDATIETIRSAIAAEVSPFLARVTDRKVVDQASYEADLEDGKKAAAFVRRIEGALDPLAADFNALHKRATTLIRTFTDPLNAIKSAISKRTYAWSQAEKERVRREREAAQKKADEERRRIEADRLREAERIEAEARMKEQADREAAERSRKDAAQILQEAGRGEAAQEILNRPIEIQVDAESKQKVDELLSTPVDVTPEEVRPSEAAKVKGAAQRENWKWRLLSLQDLVLAVAAGEVPLDAVTTNDKWLTEKVKKLREAMRYKGVEAYDEGTVAFGR